jgi:putative transcriptional regulator
MSANNTIVARRLPDGSLVQVLPDGTTRPMAASRTDWAALRDMTDEEALVNARSDPENPTIEDYAPGRLRRAPQVRQVRRALHLTQEEFSARFSIPLGTLRDWEQGKCEPDQAARAYLRVIAAEPDAVVRALAKAAAE